MVPPKSIWGEPLAHFSSRVSHLREIQVLKISTIRGKAKIVRVQVAPTPGPSPNAGGGETARFPVLLPLSQYWERGLGGEGLNAYGTPWRMI